MLTKKKLRYWLNLVLLALVVAAIPIGWWAVSASVSAKLGGTLLTIVALFTTVLPAKRKDIIEAIDKSGLPEDDGPGLSAIPSILILLALFTGICAILYSAPTRADDSPQFGGCFAAGEFCAGPSAAITVAQFNLATSKFSGGVSPGLGYGITYKPYLWYATGVSAYLSLSIGGGQPSEAIPSLMVSFANYLRIGAGVSITETDGPTRSQWRLMFGIGSDFGGSSDYVRKQVSSASQ